MEPDRSPDLRSPTSGVSPSVGTFCGAFIGAAQSRMAAISPGKSVWFSARVRRRRGRYAFRALHFYEVAWGSARKVLMRSRFALLIAAAVVFAPGWYGQGEPRAAQGSDLAARVLAPTVDEGAMRQTVTSGRGRIAATRKR